MYEKLFETGKINNLEIKNRIIMTAMHLGKPVNEEVEFYKVRAKGGAGLIITVAGVNKMGAYNNMIIIDDQHKEDLKKLADSVHEYESKMFVQLFHAGRNGAKGLMAEPEIEPVAPSVVTSPIYQYEPKELSLDEIKTTIEDFGKAALLCKDAGIDGVEISCSAGYLLSQFLSSLTNLRNDDYGGSEEKRRKFPTEVIEKVREYVGPDYPVILRISGSDMLGGYGIGEMQRFCASLRPGLIDAVDVTGGWHESPVPQITSRLPEGGYSFLAGMIKRVVKVPVIACNRINNGVIAEEILQKGFADFVGCARAFITDAEFANKIRDEIPYRKCIACNKGCLGRILQFKPACCVLNPESGKEVAEITKTELKKRVLVIGGGPAGMEAAKYAAKRGHGVTLCTKDSELGGLLNAAEKPPFKKDIGTFVKSLAYELEQLNVDIKFNIEVDAKYIDGFDPDHVIVATGSVPIVPRIEGIDCPNVYFAEDVLCGQSLLIEKLLKGRTIIIGGGAVGLETAHFLAEQIYLNHDSLNFMNAYVQPQFRPLLLEPASITVVEMMEKAGKDLGANRWIILNELKQLGVKLLTNTKVIALRGGELITEYNEAEISLPADNVILAIGYRSNSAELIKYLEDRKFAYSMVGDALKVGTLSEGLNSALEEALKI